MSVTINGNGPITGLGPAGQVRLSVVAGSLVMKPFQGNQLFINGRNVTVPDAGVTLAGTGGATATAYNIYASESGGTITLERSTSAHATHASFGHEIMSGDATRSLVAKAAQLVAGTWVDSSTARYLINWFNRRPRGARGAFAAARAWGTANTYTELDSAGRSLFLSWGDHDIPALVNGAAQGNTVGMVCQCGPALNSTSALSGNTAASSIGTANTEYVPQVVVDTLTPTEGLNYLTVLCAPNTGTGTWTLQTSAITQG